LRAGTFSPRRNASFVYKRASAWSCSQVTPLATLLDDIPAVAAPKADLPLGHLGFRASKTKQEQPDVAHR